MFVPFISKKRHASDRDTHRTRVQTSKKRRKNYLVNLEPRKGGGGGGKGSGGSSGKGSGKGGSGGKGGNSGGKSSSSSINTDTGKGYRPAVAYGGGGGSVVKIPNGLPFAGRPAGGGTRNQIFGSGFYGSGYPGIYGRGTFGRGFPFYYWPVVWWGGPYYLHPYEYGSPTNTTRPGGALSIALFSNTTSNPSTNQTQTTVLRVLSDNDTVSLLIPQLTDSCSDYIRSPSDIQPLPYVNDSSAWPQAIQYYRASSIVLSLDGYNNTAALIGDNSTDPSITAPLPSNVNLDFINCMNTTIGDAAPLVSDAGRSLKWSTPPSAGLFGLVWVVWVLMQLV